MDDKSVYDQLRNTIYTSLIALIPNIVYVFVFCCRNQVKDCLIEVGTIFPTTVLIATATWEVLDVSWFSKDKTDYKAEGRAEGREETIEELLGILEKEDTEGMTLSELIAVYRGRVANRVANPNSDSESG